MPTARTASRDALLRALAQFLPPHRISVGEADRLVYSRDMWPRTLLAVRDAEPTVAPPDAIVWPETTAEIARIVRAANDHRVPLVAWGAGSGVCGAAMTTERGIVLDLKRMSAVVSVDDTDHLATFQPGILGQTLEDQLNLRGLTLGHFPSSIYCSTLGGWIATRSAGQLSSRYGKIEDMVESVQMVLGDGRVVRFDASEWPDALQVIVGSEGTLGVITEATLRVHRLHPYRLFRAYEFPRVAAGCEGIRRVMQRGLRPSVVRLYDELDTLIAQLGHGPEDEPKQSLWSSVLEVIPESITAGLRRQVIHGVLSRAASLGGLAERVVPQLSGGCLLVIGCEGEPQLARLEAALCHSELLAAGGRDLGEQPGVEWFERRYAVSYKQSPLYATGSFADTMEVAATWDRLLDLYHRVRQVISEQAFVMAHFSHAYPEGCSIYFTFAAAADDRKHSEQLYDAIWRRGLAAAAGAGGVISHHHGVGLSKAGFMAEELGTSGLNVYRRLKRALDPAGILNPGKMGL